MRDEKRFEWLRSLAPLEAVKAALEGEWGMGDLAAVTEAIRKDARITLSDEQIWRLLDQGMMESKPNPEKWLKRLVREAARVQAGQKSLCG